jgi:hypothetical protein
MRFVGLLPIILCLAVGPNRAVAADDTIAWYLAQGYAGRMGFADATAAILRENHPGLTGAHMKACLDDMARYRNNSALSLRYAAALCAN